MHATSPVFRQGEVIPTLDKFFFHLNQTVKSINLEFCRHARISKRIIRLLRSV